MAPWGRVAILRNDLIEISSRGAGDRGNYGFYTLSFFNLDTLLLDFSQLMMADVSSSLLSDHKTHFNPFLSKFSRIVFSRLFVEASNIRSQKESV